MKSAFLFPFMLAFFWTTLGCSFIRKVWGVKYDAIFVFWMITVFAFTFVNRIAFLDKMVLIDAVEMSAVAFFIPILSYFGYRNLLANFCDSEKYPAILYGFALIISATVCAFNVSAIVHEIGGSNVSDYFGGLNFFSILLVQLALASLGLFISLRAKNI
jgi:hypothetical protein